MASDTSTIVATARPRPKIIVRINHDPIDISTAYESAYQLEEEEDKSNSTTSTTNSSTLGSSGAISTFLGVTRNIFQGKQVLRLEYEAYVPMALKQLQQVCEAVIGKVKDEMVERILKQNETGAPICLTCNTTTTPSPPIYAKNTISSTSTTITTNTTAATATTSTTTTASDANSSNHHHHHHYHLGKTPHSPCSSQSLQPENGDTLKPTSSSSTSTNVDPLDSRLFLQYIYVQHRLGVVPVGQASVFILVASAHRDASLTAVRMIIDDLKATVPIWKKEIYLLNDTKHKTQEDGTFSCSNGSYVRQSTGLSNENDSTGVWKQNPECKF